MNNVVQLQAGASCVRLVPGAGARISSLRLAPDGMLPVDVLYPYPEDFVDPVRWAKGGIYPLMPFSNRIEHARVRVRGEQVPLQPHPDALPHSLHGNAHLLPWALERHDVASAVMVLDAPASVAWPWHYTGRLDVALTSSELHLRITLRHAGMGTMPAGIGLHPYFCHEPQALLAYRASEVWPPTADFLARHSRVPRGDEVYHPARTLPAGGLTHYAGGWDGIAEIGLPHGARLHMQAEGTLRHLVVHRPDNLAYLCVEPVSHVADGFNLAARGVPGTGTQWLAPGQALSGELRLSLKQGALP
jgi:aldose 1-epimerase